MDKELCSDLDFVVTFIGVSDDVIISVTVTSSSGDLFDCEHKSATMLSVAEDSVTRL